MIRRIGVMLAAGVLSLTAACYTIEMPAATPAQLINPEWAWAGEAPRERARGGVRMRFPKCHFQTPEEKKTFENVVREVERLGRLMPHALKRGEISSEDYVANLVVLEFIAAQLLALCEGTTPPSADSLAMIGGAEVQRAGAGITAADLSRSAGSLPETRRLLERIASDIR